MNELLLEKYAYKKKKPVLLPYLDDIKILLDHDATQKSVLEYLKNEKGITVSQPYLSKFIRQYIYNNKTIDPAVKPIEKKSDKETQKSKSSNSVDPNSNSDNSSKETATETETKEELSKDSEPIQNTTSSKKEELDDDTLASMEEYMKNMSHIFEAKKRRQ